MLIPYLSSVYYGLTAHGGAKDYLTASKTQLYLNLPDVIARRVVAQINANGDERIDHDEFVGFMLQAAMGTKIQKLRIAFAMYDMDGNQNISEDEICYIWLHIPERYEFKYGVSFGEYDTTARLSKQ